MHPTPIPTFAHVHGESEFFVRCEFGSRPASSRLGEKKVVVVLIVGEHASNVCGLIGRIIEGRGTCTCQNQMTYLPTIDIPTHGDIECNH